MGAPRPRYRPTRCRRCGARSPDAQISYNGLCSDCGEAKSAEAIHAMVDQSGPLYEKWKAGQKAAAQRMLEQA